MSYTHLTKTELVFIEEYHAFGLSGRKIAKILKRGQEQLPMQLEENPMVTKKKEEKNFKRSIRDRDPDHLDYQEEFGHLECDTIVGRHHKSAVITLVERLTKCIIAIKPNGRQAADKEFSNWKNISNTQDIDIHFADLGTPSQRGINEHSNGLLRKNGLPKVLDFNSVSQEEISHVAFRRNNIPRKSLNYQTPIECFMSYVGDKFDKSILFHLF